MMSERLWAKSYDGPKPPPHVLLQGIWPGEPTLRIGKPLQEQKKPQVVCASYGGRPKAVPAIFFLLRKSAGKDWLH